MALYRTFADQALHYFMRPHDHIPTEPIETEANWRAPIMSEKTSEWLIKLTPDEIHEIEDITGRLIALNVPMSEINKSQFKIPTLANKIPSWRNDIVNGRGFVVLRGLPVTDWGYEKSAYAYWGLGHHLGLPGAQNPQDELLGHVVDYSEEKDNPIVRRYRTTGNIDFHCDAADLVGLLCLRNAKSGGQSRIVSSVSIFNEICKCAPNLVPRLFEPFFLDRRDEHGPGEPPFLPIPPCRYSVNRKLQTFYHSEYFRSVERLDSVFIDEAAKELLNLYDSLCLSPEFQLDMWLEPGDMQFISNHTIVHSRTSYEDWPEKERKRHLLRLWLSIV